MLRCLFISKFLMGIGGGIMSVKDLLLKKNEYIAGIGGYLELLESDGNNNELNREIIKEYAKEHAACYLGKINFFGTESEALINGERSCYEKYVGKEVLNFEYSFIIPSKDPELEEMIIKWNSGNVCVGLIDSIMERIDYLGGYYFVWS